MNDIRINKEEEKEIVKARFKIPPLIFVLFILFTLNALVTLIVGIALEVISMNDSNYYGDLHSSNIFLIAFGIVLLLFVLPIFIIWMVGIKKSACVVTDKRIYGVTNFFIVKKKYSYRLDEIENVETVSTIGIHGLALNFSQGHGPQGVVKYDKGVATVSGAGVFKITNIANIDEIYDKLSKLLTSVKNDKDVMIDVEMSKVEAENRKAAAFESMATNVGETNISNAKRDLNYIEELKSLKELLDAGIINEKEFESKKKQLLNLT